MPPLRLGLGIPLSGFLSGLASQGCRNAGPRAMAGKQKPVLSWFWSAGVRNRGVSGPTVPCGLEGKVRTCIFQLLGLPGALGLWPHRPSLRLGPHGAFSSSRLSLQVPSSCKDIDRWTWGRPRSGMVLSRDS